MHLVVGVAVSGHPDCSGFQLDWTITGITFYSQLVVKYDAVTSSDLG
jgi:hypothetical protein